MVESEAQWLQLEVDVDRVELSSEVGGKICCNQILFAWHCL